MDVNFVACQVGIPKQIPMVTLGTLRQGCHEPMKLNSQRVHKARPICFEPMLIGDWLALGKLGHVATPRTDK